MTPEQTAQARAAIAGKTSAEVVAMLIKAEADLNITSHPWLLALADRNAAKAERRAAKRTNGDDVD